jgi:signal transduction histidine kinase
MIACPYNGSAKTITFRVRISPVDLCGERVYLSVFQDITASKRHELFDRVFLHDLSNLALGLLGWTAELPEGDDPEPVLRVRELAGRIAEQLDDQRALVQVEHGAWHLEPTVIDPEALAQTLEIWFGAHLCARKRKLRIEQTTKRGNLVSDPKLLNRVLGNLLKNAFEATPEGGTVKLTISIDAQRARFEVHNPGCIPREVAAQLLKQPVTTKATGHGLGLYSVQLFGELYLGGSVSFDSTEEHGTCFRYELPTSQQSLKTVQSAP